MMEYTQKDIDRFFKHVLPEPNSGCWLWDSSVNKQGYGQFHIKSHPVRAHRFAFFALRGLSLEARKGVVCHKCDVTGCVNPDHLWLGTAKENAIDAVKKGRWTCAKKGANHYNARLSTDEVLFIRISDIPNMQAAARFGVSYGTIYAIRNNLRWRNI